MCAILEHLENRPEDQHAVIHRQLGRSVGGHVISTCVSAADYVASEGLRLARSRVGEKARRGAAASPGNGPVLECQVKPHLAGDFDSPAGVAPSFEVLGRLEGVVTNAGIEAQVVELMYNDSDGCVVREFAVLADGLVDLGDFPCAEQHIMLNTGTIIGGPSTSQ